MKMCLDCFVKSKDSEYPEFYNLPEIRYVRLSNENLECDVCHQEKRVIANAVYKVLDTFKGNPPGGWINVEEIVKRAENTPYNEGNDAGSVNPQEGR